MIQDFDRVALHAALDTRRTALGLSWAEVGAAIGVSAGTLRGLGTRPRAEGDGVLRAVAWLGRNPESFIPGQTPGALEAPLPVAAARALRFDARALYAALEAERAARGMTWRAVAAASGASAGGLTRLRSGGRVVFPEVMRMLAWLGAPAARFVRPEGQ
jgi:transcriptional regulator with XRE-family HTH domain